MVRAIFIAVSLLACTVAQAGVWPGRPVGQPAVPATGGFAPSSLGAALLAHWNADDHGTANMTDDGGGLISSWIDRVSGVAMTGTTTARPTWTSGIVTFDGAATCLRTTSFAALPTGANPSVIWLSATQDGASGTSRVAFKYGTSGADTARDIETNSTNGLRLNAGTTTLAYGVTTTGYHVMSGGFLPNGGVGMLTGRIDGKSRGAALQSGALATGTTRAAIGSNIGAACAAFWQGAIYDAIVTRELTPIQNYQLEGWLAWKAGRSSVLPNDHPFRFARP